MAAATPTSTLDLLDLLQKSRIWPDAELQSRLAALGPVPEEPNLAAALLIKHGLLTPFQARILMGGKYRGFRLGAYVIRGQIGQGGMGAVYLAHHEALRRPVAIKVLTPPDKSAVTKVNVERFLREARSVAALDHPNIVRIFDVAQLGEMHYLVMEYVEGQTLDQMVSVGGPVSCGRAVEYMLQAAAGLEHAHQKGFVHRDIKPANLILARDGTLKILDMGLARSDETEDKVTEVFDKGAVVGTADYISPEQAMNAPDLDIRADIYSLGATFYTLLTGRPPFTGNTTQKLMQHQIKEAPPLDALDKTFPPDLARLVAKMMKKRPADRYQTPGEVMAALGPWLSNTSQVVAALSRVESRSSIDLQQTLNEVVSGSTKRLNDVIARAAEQRRPSRVPYAVGGVAAVALVLVAFGGLAAYALSGSADKAPAFAQQPQQHATPPAPAPAASRRPPMPTPVVARNVAVYSFDAAGLTDFRETWHSEPGKNGSSFPEQVVTASSGDGKLPEGWARMNYKVGTTSEVAVATVRGSKAIGLTTTDGDHTTMVFTPNFLVGRPKLRLKIEYLLEGTEGSGSALFAKLVPAPAEEGRGCGDLAATDGKWVTREFEFDAQGATEGRLEFHTYSLKPGKMLWIRSLAVTAATPAKPAAPAPGPRKAVYSFDATTLTAFREQFRTATNIKAQVRELVALGRSGEGKLPAGWRLENYRDDTVAEVAVDAVGGGNALGVTTLEGNRSTMMLTPLFESVAPNLTLKIEYLAEGTVGKALIRLVPVEPREGLAVSDLAELPATGGQWVTREFPIDVKTSTLCCFEFHTASLALGKTVWIRSYTVTGGGDAAKPAPATARATAFSFSAGDLDPFKQQWRQVAGQDEQVVLGNTGAGKLPTGWDRRNYKTDTVSEVAVGTVQGAKALGYSTVEGACSTMLFSPPVPFSGGDLVVSVEYLIEGSAGEASLRLRRIDPTSDAEDSGKLPATSGKWATREFRIDSKGAATGLLEFHVGTIELGKTIWIKSITATGGDPASE